MESNSGLRILFVEDLPSDNELAQRQIRKGGIEFTSLRVETRSAFLSALDEYKPDLIISDYSMPEFNGLDALVLAQEFSPLTPFIVLTGSMNEDTAVVCMKGGASDYVIKEHMHRLPFAIKEALELRKQEVEKAKAEARVRHLSNRLQHYVEASPVVLFAFDFVAGKFKVAWISQNILRVLGYSVEEALEPGWYQSHINSEDQVFDMQGEPGWLDKTQDSLSKEYRFQCKDGKVVWVNEDIRIIRNADGTPSEAFSSMTDISARKISEEQLNLQSEALNAAANAIVITDPDGTIEWMNPSFCKLTGYTFSEALGKNPRALVKSDVHDQAFYKDLWDTVLSGQVWRGEIVNRRKDGSIYTEEETITPVRNDQGKVQHIVAIKEDATLRKEAEMAQARHVQQQEMLVSLGWALGATLDLPTVYQTAHKHIQKMIDCPNFGISFYDPQQEILKTAFMISDDIQFDIRYLPPLKVTPVDASEGRSKAVISQKPVLVDGLAKKRKNSAGKLSGSDREPQSALYVPMLVEGLVMGLLELESFQPNAYKIEDGEWLSVVANQVGLAIQNGRLYSQARQRLSELAALHELDSAVTEHLGLQNILEIALKQIISRLKVDAANFLLLDDQKQTLVYAAGRGFSTQAAETTQLILGNGLASVAVLEKRKVQILGPAQNEKDFISRETWAGENFAAYVGVPLIVKNEVVGVLEVFNRSALSPDPDWYRFLEMLAGQAAIAIDNSHLINGLQEANVSLLQAYDATIEGWSHALDLRDKETEGHTQRVTELTLNLARSLGLKQETLEFIRHGALLHDIGKLGVPDHILHKPGPLTADEWITMKKHPLYAYEMLKPIHYLRPALDIPYCHHEKWDGSGYPQGLKGEEIPLTSRLFAIVDVWDALTSDRPYRPAWTREEALKYIADQSGRHFDPEMVAAFLSVVNP
jgi:PAS domain S-box-containing protein/putative nucleotidyltransferase with HDIG domain